MKDKTIIIGFVMFVILIIGLVTYFAFSDNKINNCLEEISIDICKDNGLSFGELKTSTTIFTLPKEFSCINIDRQKSNYLLLTEEKESCRK